jgi:hypothetical protein
VVQPREFRCPRVASYILALWRMLAWKPEGSPIKDFVLETDAILDAERRLIAGMLTL